MPLLILVCNNAKYAAMQYYHDQFYPFGHRHGGAGLLRRELKGTKYENAAAMVDGYGKRVETPAE